MRLAVLVILIRVNTRTRALITVAALMLALAGCGDPKPVPGIGTGSPSAAPSVSPDPKAADEAAVKVIVARYWDVFIALQEHPSNDRTVFNGIITGSGGFVEGILRTSADYRKRGVSRVGELRLGPTVLSRHSTAEYRASQCFDESHWDFKDNGKVLRATDLLPGYKPQLATLTIRKVDGSWRVADRRLGKGGTRCAG